MGKIGDNEYFKGFSGKFGDAMVFQKNGYFRSLPDFSKRKLSPDQEQHLSEFERAKQFGRAVEANPDLQPLYKAKAKKGLGAYQVAIHAYKKYPEVRKDPTLISGIKLEWELSV